jgi:hypothetical protein
MAPGPTNVAGVAAQAQTAWLGHAESCAAMPSDKSHTQLTPEQKIKALEVQLNEANKKTRLFETMLYMPKKDYGVRVVKAFGQVLAQQLLLGLGVKRVCLHMAVNPAGRITIRPAYAEPRQWCNLCSCGGCVNPDWARASCTI